MKLSPRPWGTTNSRIELDISRTTLQEGYWGDVRISGQIASLAASRKGADGAYTRNVRFWKSGCFTLAPIQQRFSEFQESAVMSADLARFRTDTDGATNPFPSVYIRSVQLLQKKIWSEPTGIGFVHQSGTAFDGDSLYRKSVDGITTFWDSRLTDLPPPPQLSTGSNTIAGVPEWDGMRVPLDCVWHSKYNQKPNQGFYLRWLCPGTPYSTPDTILNFYFGQFCLIIGGSGEAILAEYAQPRGGGAYRWRKRDSFRYCKQGRAVGQHHTMQIFPHQGLQGQKYIIFASNDMDATTGGAAGVLTAGSSQSVVTDEFLFELSDTTRSSDMDESHGYATREGIIRMDIRRDLMVGWHVSQLIFRNSGGINDGLWALPDSSIPTATNPLLSRLLALYPEGADGTTASMTGIIVDAYTNSTTDIKYPAVALRFFGTDPGTQGFSYSTPIFWGYELYRPATTIVDAPGKFTVPIARATIISASSGDPKQERGEISLHDLQGAYPRFRNRGGFAGRVVVDYKPETGDQATDAAVMAVPVVLSAGEALRPQVTAIGTTTGTAPNHQDISLLMTGMGERLADASIHNISTKHFAVDDQAVPENLITYQKPAWKITDIIGFVLMNRGFPESQVLIGARKKDGITLRDTFDGVFESPIRLWSGAEEFVNDEKFDTYTDPLSYCVALCRNYLGAYLIFDANAGPLDSSISGNINDKTPLGAWRIIRPLAGSTPVWNFVKAPQNSVISGGLAMANYPAAYAAKTAPYRAMGTIYAIRPDHNHVWVFCGPSESSPGKYKFERHLFNHQSYYVPGSGVVPNPDSPHYIGHERIAIVPDATLFVPNDLPKTQLAVDFTARRIFDFACRGRRGFRFKAPLITIIDPITARRRPLQFGDSVTLDGTTGWFIKTASYSIESRNHEADYEIEKLEPL